MATLRELIARLTPDGQMLDPSLNVRACDKLLQGWSLSDEEKKAIALAFLSYQRVHVGLANAVGFVRASDFLVAFARDVAVGQRHLHGGAPRTEVDVPGFQETERGQKKNHPKRRTAERRIAEQREIAAIPQKVQGIFERLRASGLSEDEIGQIAAMLTQPSDGKQFEARYQNIKKRQNPSDAE
jgi:hypothetical protein